MITIPPGASAPAPRPPCEAFPQPGGSPIECGSDSGFPRHATAAVRDGLMSDGTLYSTR